jgi:hypothetical protein
MTTHLAHAPFTFHTGGFSAGRLEAVGYHAGRAVARHTVRTPGQPARLHLSVDLSGRRIESNAKDVIFCRAALEDANGSVVPDAWHNVAFGVTGPGTIRGMNPFASDAGISTFVLETTSGDQSLALYALSLVPANGKTHVLAGSVALRGRARTYVIRHTTDGSEPGASSELYRGPIATDGVVRAALFVGTEQVAALASDAPKFRIPVSAPPDQKRTPFEH